MNDGKDRPIQLFSIIENKKLHFNNQLNKLENYNKIEVENAFHIVKEYIKVHKLNKKLINNTTIYHILKKNNCKKDFIFIMYVANRLYNVNFVFTPEMKTYLMNLFEFYVKFIALKNQNEKKKNIHYSSLFFYFFKLLNIKTCIDIQEKIILSNNIIANLKEFINQMDYNIVTEENDNTQVCYIHNSYFGEYLNS